MDTGMNILVRNQRHLIDGFLDEDGQKIQLSISTWVENDTIGTGVIPVPTPTPSSDFAEEIIASIVLGE
jgi:hypothetical protein